MRQLHQNRLLFVLGLLLLWSFCFTPEVLWAETEKTIDILESTESKSDPQPLERVGLHTQKMEMAGKKIESGVHKLEEVATLRIGGWVGTEALLGITWLELLITLLLIFLVMFLERVLQIYIQSKLENLPADEGLIPWRKLFLRALSKPLTLFIWVYGTYLSLSPILKNFGRLHEENVIYSVARKGADIGGTIAIIWFFVRLVALMDVRLKKWTAATESTIDDMLAPLVGKTLRIFIVIIGGIILLQNLTDIEIGPLLASLGLGGLAFALAAKDSVANLFGTITIFFDKPFQVGERIVISDYDGVVESVGFRSTRLRTLTGHLVTIPNEKVISNTVENIGKRPHIRWLNNVTITYDTPPDKVETAVRIIRNILENHEGLHPDFPPRVYFNGFNDWSLNILMLAWYHPADYWNFQNWVQKTCLSILREFRKENIDFAFPSQTHYLANDDQRQLKLMLIRGESEDIHP